MLGSIIQTKLYAPRRRGTTVPRQRLRDRLSAGIDTRLTLVSAPAGFGKTTLLASWLASGSRSNDAVTAWLSLDPSDNDPTAFWSYVMAAVQAVAPTAATEASALIETGQSPIQAVVATLVNELNALPKDLVLVLDDYHVIEDRQIHEAISFLIDHLPPHVHVVIASRADPPLPVARWRARGELVEIRSADLRFTSNELAAYFTDVMPLDLGSVELAILEQRTEGWIAALQLTALSMQGRRDLAGFIRSFAGDDRYIVDYLVEEVLQRQPAHVNEFLLQTSVLNRLNGPLCDAVTGQDGGKAMLEALDRANLFLVALDDRRQWYRYHHLFGDVLRAHLTHEQPGQVPELHRRASAWYELNGELHEAIHHALTGNDFGHAADLVERAWPALRTLKQEATLRGWLEALPDELLRYRPVLSNAYAGVLLTGGEIEGVDRRLRDAERWLVSKDRSTTAAAGMIVVDEEEFRRLPNLIALHRAGYALALGDLIETVNHARRAIDLAPDDQFTRGGATALMGLAAWATGDLETAYRTYAEGMANVQRTGHISGAIGTVITLADLRVAQGRLREATRMYEQSLRLATEQGGAILYGTADMYVGISELQCERNELDAATQSLLRSRELGEHAGFSQNRHRWRVAMARIHEARGDLAGALDLLAEGQPLFMVDFSPNVRPITAVRARVLVRLKRLDEALDWARERGMSLEDELAYVHEYEHITLARILLAGGSVVQAAGLLDRLLQAAEAGGRTGSIIEILVLQALASELRTALVPLERALVLAEPEGYVRMFVDEGPPMAALLQAAARRGIAPGYVQRLLSEFGLAESEPHVPQNMLEPLSERELDVLRLLATDLDGPEIASQLVVSLNTMRTHTKSIYAKLGVNGRRAAVRRAQELALLSR